jgi:hypothetical protein
MNKKLPGPTCTARTPENIARVREALIRSPGRSARRHASEYLKGRVYTHKPRNLNELKDVIWKEMLTVDQQQLGRVIDDFKQKFENCIEENGLHLNDIIIIFEYLTQMACLDL